LLRQVPGSRKSDETYNLSNNHLRAYLNRVGEQRIKRKFNDEAFCYSQAMIASRLFIFQIGLRSFFLCDNVLNVVAYIGVLEAIA